MDVAFDLAGPAQKSPEFAAFTPHELPKLQKTDLLHLDAGVSFDAPEKIWTAPGSQMVSACGIPEEADLVAHGPIITTNVLMSECALRNARSFDCVRRIAAVGALRTG